jgi:hypothetical protein
MTTEPDRLEVMQALKPCPVPWCLEAEQLSFIVSHWSGNACVECLTCKARGPWEASKETAITAWNTRPIETNSRTDDTGEGSAASASPTIATHEPSPSGLGPSGECQLAVSPQLLADLELHLQSCRVFLTSREKLHPYGVDLHDEIVAQLKAVIDSLKGTAANPAVSTEANLRCALRSALDGLHPDSTPIIRRLARIKIKHVLAGSADHVDG